jgi:hypothetical protein
VLAGDLSQSLFALGERSPGYIDSAVPTTQFRLRYDSLRDANRPDRAEFFYPKYVSGTLLASRTTNTVLPGAGPGLPSSILSNTTVFRIRNPVRGRGPGQDIDVNPSSADFRETTAYLELAPWPRLSVFVSAPYRAADINYQPGLPVTESFAGPGDTTLGFKYALVATPDTYLSFQYSYTMPTGAGVRALGTEHVSVEPALLLTTRLTDRLTLYGELRDWRAIGGEPFFSGTVRRYGLGVGYLLIDAEDYRVSPIVEVVWWHVRKGQETRFQDGATVDASGTNIANVKYGVRIGLGNPNDPPGLFSRSDLYVGYGLVQTGERWYRHVTRVEYRIRF